MSKHAAIIVTYFPDAEALKNLESLCDLCDTVIVIDNTTKPEMESFPGRSNLKVLNCPENTGLAAALNAGIRLAKNQKIEDIFLFDQDSRPSDHYFQEMLDFKSSLRGTLSRTTFYVPNFYDRNSKTFATFPLINRFSLRHVTCENMPLVSDNSALIAITSGMLITLSDYKAIGPFREDYFIDFVDNEYCLRANLMGYSVVVNCHVLLDHAVGRRSTKRLLGLAIKPNHHNPVRRYYIFRNGIRTTIDYFRPFPIYAVLMTARLGHELVSILLFEKDKLMKTKAMLLGIWHGLTNRMGKCPVAF